MELKLNAGYNQYNVMVVGVGDEGGQTKYYKCISGSESDACEFMQDHAVRSGDFHTVRQVVASNDAFGPLLVDAGSLVDCLTVID